MDVVQHVLFGTCHLKAVFRVFANNELWSVIGTCKGPWSLIWAQLLVQVCFHIEGIIILVVAED